MEHLPDLKHLMHEEKDALILLLWKQNQLLQKQVYELKLKIKELENRLSKNSQNSSKPPSTDGFNKPNSKSLRPRGKNKQGGQKGHTGITLKQTATPDFIIEHRASHCGGCGKSLDHAPVTGCEKRQVFDIPVLKIQVTEHRSYKKTCCFCHTVSGGIFSVEAYQVVQYGPRIKTLMVYMSQFQLLPYGRLKEFFKDVFNQSVSTGTLVNTNREAFERLDSVEAKIKAKLAEAPILHVDETGCRVDKKTYWLHVASTRYLTYYGIHEKRGSKAAEAIGLLPAFKGTLVHDHLKSYFNYGKSHALCNAHHLRELIFVQERYDCAWAIEMKKHLLHTKHRVETYYQETGKRLSDQALKRRRSRYMNILANGKKECPRQYGEGQKRGRAKQTEAYNLLERLRQFNMATLAFMYNPAIPFDNNQAERDIRMTKVKQKVGGCFRSQVGAQEFCRIRGFISTMRKNSVDILAAIFDVFINKPVFLATLA